jgi:2-dehydropantoate 2-reductase
MKIAVVGAGAIGSWLGGALARAGHDTTLIARDAHADAIRAGGLTVRGDGESYTVHPRLEPDGPVDAVLLTTKAHDQLAAAPLVRELLGPDTPVVAAQNGVPWWYFHPEARHIEAVDPGGALSAAIPPQRAIGLVAYLGASLPEPGVVAVRPEAGIDIGEPSGESTDRLRAIAGALREAGFVVREREDIRREIWAKLLGNASFNPISLLTRAGLGSMARDPGTREVIAAVMAETMAVARALGAEPAIAIEERLAITERLGEHRTSTLQDFEAGKPLELAALVEAVLELAAYAGVPVPTLRTVGALAFLADRTARQ